MCEVNRTADCLRKHTRKSIAVLSCVQTREIEVYKRLNTLLITRHEAALAGRSRVSANLFNKQSQTADKL
jgi:hypothetical protein